MISTSFRRSYIGYFSDYRGLKKQITAIRNVRQEQPPDESITEELSEPGSQADLDQPGVASPRPPSDVARVSSISRRDPNSSAQTKRTTFQTPSRGENSDTLNELVGKSSGLARLPSVGRSMSASKRTWRRNNIQTGGKHIFISCCGNICVHVIEAGSQRSLKPSAAIPLHELMLQLSPEETKFFDMLNSELDKIESFYVTREKETQERSGILREQLNRLSEHKKIVQVHFKLYSLFILISLL
jgi:SPX domain